MLYVGPSTRAVAELRSLRAGFTLSETTAADGGESKGTRGLGKPEDLAGSCRERVKSGRNQRVVGVGGISEGRGDRGGKHQLDVSRKNPRYRRKETRKGAGRIPPKSKRMGMMVTFSSMSGHWERVLQV